MQLAGVEPTDEIPVCGVVLTVRTVSWYLIGLTLIGASMASRDFAVARFAFVAGFLAAGLGPWFTLGAAWLDESF